MTISHHRSKFLHRMILNNQRLENPLATIQNSQATAKNSLTATMNSLAAIQNVQVIAKNSLARYQEDT